MWKAIKAIKEIKKLKPKVRIIAYTTVIYLIADIIIWLLATANWQRIAWINLFVLSSCCLVLVRNELLD